MPGIKSGTTKGRPKGGKAAPAVEAPPESGRYQQVGVSLDPGTASELAKIAAKRFMPRSQLCRIILSEFAEANRVD